MSERNCDADRDYHSDDDFWRRLSERPAAGDFDFDEYANSYGYPPYHPSAGKVNLYTNDDSGVGEIFTALDDHAERTATYGYA